MIGKQGAATALTTLLLTFLMMQGVKAPFLLVFLCAAAFCYVIVSCGLTIQRMLGATDLPLAAAWPLGVMPTGLALWILVALLEITAAAAFAIWTVVVVALDLWTRRRAASQATLEVGDVIGLGLCCAFTAAWCREVAAAPAVLEATGTFPAWADYFLHAGVISQFGDPRAIGRGLIWLSDTPAFAYHYASYLPAAAFALPLDQPGLPIATSVWLPIGFLCATAATYTLGARFGGMPGGLAGLLALFVIPDASNYGFQNGLFSFHWLLVAVPGSTYGLASALLAVAFQQQWVVKRDGLNLIASAGFLVATAFMRVHVFLLLVPAWLLAQIYFVRDSRHYRAMVLTALVVIASGVLVVAAFSTDLARHVSWVFDGGRAFERFLIQVYRLQEPTSSPGLNLFLLSNFDKGFWLAIAALLIYPICLGAFLFALPITVSFLCRTSIHAPSIAFPAALLLSYGLVMLVAPIPSHNDATDLIQRSFVLLYATVAIWTFGSAVLWLSGMGTPGKRLDKMVAVAAALSLPVVWISASDLARPKPRWATPWNNHHIQSELTDLARFLRARGKPGELFAAPTRPIDVWTIDPQTVVSALTGMPSYLARFSVLEMLAGPNREVAYRRRAELRAIENANDMQTAKSELKRRGIRWYLVSEPGLPVWDQQRKSAVKTGKNFALYDSAN